MGDILGENRLIKKTAELLLYHPLTKVASVGVPVDI